LRGSPSNGPKTTSVNQQGGELVTLEQLKVSTNKFEINEMPVYFKSRYMALDEEIPAAQLEFENALLATGLFASSHADPPWPKVKLHLMSSNWPADKTNRA
jgi:hypothetical protein